MPYPGVRRRAVGVLLSFALGLAGCAPARQSTPTAPPEATGPASGVTAAPTVPARTGPAKVGLLLPLSGRSAAVGRDMLDAAQMAIFDVGENNVVLLPRDTGGSGDRAAAAAEGVIGEGAELILGPLFSSSTRAVGPVAANAGVKVLSFSNDTDVAGGNVYVLGFRPEEQVNRIIRFASGRGLVRLALLAPDDGYGTLAARAFTATLGELGLQGATAFYRSDGEPSGTINSLFAAGTGNGFDGVLIADGGQRLTRVAAALQTGVAGQTAGRMLGTKRWQDDPAVLGDASLEGGWIAAVAPAADNAFRQRFRAVFSRDPDQLAALAYDATALAVLLARSGQKFDATTITDPQGFVGSLGAFRVRPDGTTEHRLAVLEVHADGLIVIDPAPQGFFEGLATN